MRILIAIFLIILAGCEEQDRPPSGAAHSPQEEMNVIVSFLKRRYSSVPTDSPLVITDTFTVEFFGESYEEFTRSLTSQASNHVPSELIRDFCDKNTKSQAVWHELGTRLHLILLSSVESDSFFSAHPDQKPDGWDRFYAKYPKSPGIITISRVGFNRKGDMAMLYVGSQSHWLAGSGQIYVFRKQDGKWDEQPVFIGPMWVS
jgi:hypothetical protein